MKVRIGGEFEVGVTALARPPVDDLPDLPSPCKLWVDTGRSALLLALREIVKQGGAREAWLPAYTCPSTIAPFLELGFSLRFYSSLGASNSSALPVPAAGCTFLFIHYFGKRNTPVAAWLEEQRAKHRFFVIEDCVQASLNSNVGEIGDYVITSYRKFLPQPDGALLGSREVIHCDLEDADEAFVSARLVGKMLRHASHHESQYLRLFDESEKRLEALRPRKISWLSSYMLQRTDVKKVARTRRSNWRNLQKLLAEMELLAYLCPLFDNLDDGEVPLGLPARVNVGNRDDFRRFLAARGIYCPIHWRLDHLNGCCADYPAEIDLSRTIITLPIDQRLGKKHLEHMSYTISKYFDNQKS